MQAPFDAKCHFRWKLNSPPRTPVNRTWKFSFLSELPFNLWHYFFLFTMVFLSASRSSKEKKKKKQKRNLVHAATFSCASVTSISRVQPCCVTTVRCLEREQHCWSKQRRRSFGGCKESRNTKSKEEEQKCARQERLLKLLGEGRGGGVGQQRPQIARRPTALRHVKASAQELACYKKKGAGRSAAPHLSFILHEFVPASEDRQEYGRQLSPARTRSAESTLSFIANAKAKAASVSNSFGCLCGEERLYPSGQSLPCVTLFTGNKVSFHEANTSVSSLQ